MRSTEGRRVGRSRSPAERRRARRWGRLVGATDDVAEEEAADRGPDEEKPSPTEAMAGAPAILMMADPAMPPIIR